MNRKAILFIVVALFLLNISNAQIHNRMTAKQITIRENNVEINFYQQGKGDTTLLFLHGWCLNGSYWENQLDYFSPSYHAIAIDLPGFGKSTTQRSNWTVEEYAHDVMAFIDTLKLKNVVLIGHSMAGEIMLQTALSNRPQIIGIIGVDNFKFIDLSFTSEQMKEMQGFFSLLEKDFKKIAPEYAERMLFHPSTAKSVKERIKTDFAKSDPQIGFGTFMNQMQYAYADAQRLEQLKYKLYLINGDSYPTNEAGLKNHCQQSYQLETISSTGHFPMIEKPQEFNIRLEKLLKGMLQTHSRNL